MILDNIKNMEQYASVHPLFRKAFSAIRELVETNAPVGRYEIDGKKVYALVQEYETKNEEDRLFECHRKYIDIQFIVEGKEMIDVKNFYDLEPEVPYNEEKDVEFYKVEEDYDATFLEAGHYAVLFTHETHRPCVAVNNTPSKVKKIVVKVLN